MADGTQTAEAILVVGGADTSGFHVGGQDSPSKMGTLLVIASCTQGATVWVKCNLSGTAVYGRYNNMWTSSFSGVLLSLL